MRDDSKPILGGTDDLVIKINEGEIAVCTGEFYRLRRIGAFVKEYEDSEDTIKLYGVTVDGKIYVSEKDDFDKTDEEFASWSKRALKDVSPIKILTLEEALEEQRKYNVLDGRTVI